LKRYPIERDETETVLLDGLRNVYLQQRTVYISVLEARPNRRQHLQAPDPITLRMAPLEKEVLSWSENLRNWNADRLKLADQSLIKESAEAERALTKALAIALISGLLLVFIGMIYILRLERQTSSRYIQLTQSRQELQQLSSRLVDAQETERRSISRELHDEIGQALGALLVDLGHLSTTLAIERPEVREQVEHMKSIAERTFQSVRNIALLLRPSMLDDLGLVSALEWQGREISRRSEVEVEVESDNVSDRLPDEYRVCIYRVVQEALNNAVRHSGAKNATVTVRQSEKCIVAQVRDDGHGFDPQRTRGLGLVGMDERVKRLSGRLTVDSKPGRGTTVTVELPLLGDGFAGGGGDGGST
jgi:signal transduction histidine kinase